MANSVTATPALNTAQLPTALPTPKSQAQYPMTRILDDDTVVVMTVQQGKDMNRRFTMFKDSMKSFHRLVDTLNAANLFLSDYSHAVWIKNRDLEGELNLIADKNYKLTQNVASLNDTIKAMNYRLDFERLRVDMSKTDVQGKFELYKTTTEMKLEDYKYKLEYEEKATRYKTTRAFIEGGLVAAVLGMTADMIHAYYFKK